MYKESFLANDNCREKFSQPTMCLEVIKFIGEFDSSWAENFKFSNVP